MAHLPCSKCGSSDAVQDYADGTYCFSCDTKKKLWTPKAQRETRHYPTIAEEGIEAEIAEIPTMARAWLYKHYFDDKLIKNYSINWAHSIALWSTKDQKYYTTYNKLVLPIFNIDYSEVEGIICRSFDEDGRKYLTQIKPEMLFYSNRFNIAKEPFPLVIITEDVISAMRVGEEYPSVSILGCSVSDRSKKLMTLVTLGDEFVIWLDNDKPGIDGAKKLHKTLSQYAHCSVLHSEKDPKCYSPREIQHLISNHYEKTHNIKFKEA
jgi:DNA primase